MHNLEQLSSVAKDVVIKYFTTISNGNNDILEKFKLYLDTYKIISSNEATDAYAKCNASSRTIKVFQNFMYEENDFRLFTLVHEYMHAASNFITEISMPVVIEEGFAEALAEVALNSYFKKDGKRFETIDSTYKPCAELVKLILAKLEKTGKDKELIYSYFFKHKRDFCDYFENELGINARRFLVSIDYIDPIAKESTASSIRSEIESVIDKTIRPELDFDIDSAIDKCGKKGLSDYYYHNLIIERHIFQKLQEKYMRTISFDKFLKLLKKFKPISRSTHFECPELDGLLKVFYFPNMNEFFEVLEYVKMLPQDIGADLLQKKLASSKNKMETVISYSKIIRGFEETSLDYLKYYDSKGKKDVKNEFLLKVLNSSKELDSFYYYELLTTCKSELSDIEKEKVLSLIINFVEKKSLKTDDPYTLKVIAVLPKYVKKLNIRSTKIDQIYNLVNKEIIEIVKTPKIRITNLNTDTLELEIDFSLSRIDSIYNLVQREDIVYLKKYLLKGLKEMISTLPLSSRKKFDKI